ncbi:conjugation system SOS inhibitor PsiB [Salmonella enterica]|nr:conjugation system SOS inhibitor PsiB [Salmonella enterica]ELF9340166.1 conjugation system SOS inhibitor PsiB [Salmonella enterica]ELT5967646.1 conjugation system SOS inhibitor PsiB [Salmonella enterica]
MRTILTPDVLKTMSCDEFEDWRDSGEDYRRELTHAVMRDLSCPENWDMNGEYRCEFGGFFPVQIRFTPSHGNYHIAVCSPGTISPAWMVVFVPASGRPFSVIRTHSGYLPELVSHTVSLTARLDADGYSQASIISILAAEGAA